MNPRKILVRVPNWIGDMVMCLPALWEIRDHFPNAHICVLARPAIGELLRGQTGFDEVMVFEHQGQHRGLVGIWRLSQDLAKKSFDCAVLFQNAFQAAVIAWLAGIPNRIGYDRDGRGWLLSQPVPVSIDKKIHHTQYYRLLVQAFTGKSEQGNFPRLQIDSHQRHRCAEQYPELFSLRNEIFVGLNPGAVYGSAKCWLPERFAEVGEELVNQYARRFPKGPLVRCVILGGPGEETLGRAIANQMSHQALVLSGQTSLQQLMVILARCSVLITNDTGPMHIAQALDVPVVAIFGATESSSTGPTGGQFKILDAGVRCSPCLLRSCPIDHRCMTQVTSGQVVESAMSFIGTGPGTTNTFLDSDKST